MQKTLGRNTVVLLGIGHTNAHVLRMWKMQPIAGAQLVCVSNFPVATYSGMLPGVLAGQYPPAAMEIDLVRLSHAAGASLIVDEVTGLDQQNRRLEFANRPPLPFEILSVGIGSRPSYAGVEVKFEDSLLPIKPMQTFLGRLTQRLESLHSARESSTSPIRIVIVGGGVGSIEIAFCLERRLTRESKLSNKVSSTVFPPRVDVELSIITASEQVGKALRDSTRQKIHRHLSQRGIGVLAGQPVRAVSENHLTLADGQEVPADIVIWATGAAAPPLLSKLNLETDDEGFLLTRPSLQTLANDHVFAVGDSGTIEGSKTPKAGVFAVRQGPVLWNNINRMLWHPPLEDFHPQTSFLKLVNTGDGQAIAEFKGFSVHSGLAWKLKNRIDSRFMAMYQDYEPMRLMIHQTEEDDIMRCLGCGGKIGGELLSSVLNELEIPPHPDVVVGLDSPDDAAVVRTHENQVTVTTDFFASPFDDPYLIGRIAMLNAASDCWAMGAEPTAALAMLQIPLGHPKAQANVMRDLLTGGIEELKKMGATLVGGHSIEGPRLLVGYTMLASQKGEPKTKGRLRAGDRLVLTKPIGTGVLLAALMESTLPGVAYQPLLDSMLLSNQIAIRLIRDFGVSAITDVTGFGLAGHLAEMLTASQVSAKIETDAIPMLPHCESLIQQGIQSTLAPENRQTAQRAQLELVGQNLDFDSPRIASLFDPQTSGGLLLGVAADHAHSVLRFLHDEGYSDSAVIGEVVENKDMGSRLKIA